MEIGDRHLKQQSIREKKDYILHVDMDAHKLWISSPDMEEEALEKAEDEAFLLPENVEIMDVEYPDRGIFLLSACGEQESERQVSFLIEPFLPQIKYLEEYSDFDDQ